MKRNRIAIHTLFLFATWACVACGKSQASQQAKDDAKFEIGIYKDIPFSEMPDITRFYKEYILLQSAENPNLEKIDSLISEYCCDSLIQNIKSGKYDYDIFLQAQDCDSSWSKSVVPADNDFDGIYYTDYIGKTTVEIEIKRDVSGKIKNVILGDIKDLQYNKSLSHKMFEGIKFSNSNICRKKVLAKYISCGKDANNNAPTEEAIRRITGNSPNTAIEFTYLEGNIDYGDFYFTVKNALSDSICAIPSGSILNLDIAFYNNVDGYHYLVPYALIEGIEILRLPSELDSLLWATEGYRIFQYDNGDDYFADGLIRVIDKDNYVGYASEDGKIIIQPQFVFGFPFENGKAKVTRSGELKLVPGSGGEYHYWDSDDWYWIDKSGNRIEQSGF